MEDGETDDLLARARAMPPQAPTALLARIEADALREQAGRVQQAAPRRPVAPARPGWLAALGGGGVLAGMVSATVAGVWIGFAQPAPVAALTERLGGASAQDDADDGPVELFPGFEILVIEG